MPGIDASRLSMLGGGVRVMAVPTLAALVAHLRGELPLAPAPEGEDLTAADDDRPSGDLADVKGEEHARRALEVAAAGGHNVIMCGSKWLHHRILGDEGNGTQVVAVGVQPRTA